MKKLLELLVTIWTLFFLIYFLLYMFYFDNLCTNIKQNNNWDYLQTISQIWECKATLVCWINNVETNKQNNITQWSCDKKINNSLELDFYMNYFSELYFNFVNDYFTNDTNEDS